MKNKPKTSTLLREQGGSFNMPGGFKVRVEILNKEDADDEMGKEALAQYFHDDHLIQLRKSRTKKQRKSDFEHELMHMTVDWVDYFVRKART